MAETLNPETDAYEPFPKTWRELEAEGVKRCCVMFRNGARCRRRAVEQFEWSWCATHGPIMQKHAEHSRKVLEEMSK